MRLAAIVVLTLAFIVSFAAAIGCALAGAAPAGALLLVISIVSGAILTSV